MGMRMFRAVPEHPTEPSSATPLCVDLDGTLVRSDMLVEGLLTALRKPAALLDLSRYFSAGRAKLKMRVAELAETDPSFLPYNEQLVVYLRQQKAMGRKLVLATAANAKVAQKIADHLAIFDEARQHLREPAEIFE